MSVRGSFYKALLVRSFNATFFLNGYTLNKNFLLTVLFFDNVILFCESLTFATVMKKLYENIKLFPEIKIISKKEDIKPIVSSYTIPMFFC